MYLKSLAELSRITGDTIYGDEMERVTFNGAQGARKKDERAIAYLTSPNQVFATMDSSYADHLHQVYAPCVPVSCCPVMSVRILPEFICGMVLTDVKDDIEVNTDGDLYFAAYAPVKIKHGSMQVEMETLYPFRDRIDFKISLAESFEKTLYFRIPAWCDHAELSINGKVQTVECTPATNAQLKRLWADGDVITLRLPMEVRISRLNDADRSGLYPIAVEYGALVFALPVPERWEAWEGKPATQLPEGWFWYNVYPDNKESTLDVYDNMGMRKHLITYNVALDENIQPDDIEVDLCELDGYPWEKPLIKMRLPAYKAPYSYPPYPSKTFEPYCEGGKAYVTDRLTIELIPYGCTNLRITYMPRAMALRPAGAHSDQSVADRPSADASFLAV
jgi:hypothetical protein